MSSVLAELERRLLMELQYDFPLCSRPFEAVAGRIGVPESKVVSRVRELRELGIIRRVGAVLNYASRGLKAYLVGLEVDPRGASDVIRKINEDAGVSHNFVRDHRYNVWFVVKRRSLDQVLSLVEGLMVKRYTVLETTRVYRLDVKLDLDRGVSRCKVYRLPESVPKIEDLGVSVELLRELYDVQVCETPFREIARRWHMSEDDLVDMVRRLIERGVLRDFYAVLNQERVGFRENAMIAVRLGDCSKLLEVVEATHVVERRCVHGDFDYNCFIVVHATSKDKIEEVVKKRVEPLSSDYVVLYSVRNLLPEMPQRLLYTSNA